jgi:hypothetical protein
MADRRHVQRRQMVLTLLPALAFVGTAIPLWGQQAEPEFFSAATHVLALGGIALVLQAGFFQMSEHAKAGPRGVLVVGNLAFLLVSVGVGLGCAFGALANGEPHHADLALVSGSMAAQIAAFAVIVLFGSPAGAED